MSITRAKREGDEPGTIEPGTRIVIPIRIAITLVVSLVVGTVSYTVYAYSCYRALLDAVHEGDRYNWTLHDQREWADEVRAHNTNVWVPDPNEIFWSHRPPRFGASATVTTPASP